MELSERVDLESFGNAGGDIGFGLIGDPFGVDYTSDDGGYK
uniref:Uncharacterized protein n=1 Tax=Nelumbo nucifera TaxID=4432 RepID=A0A822XQA7_NELNU|nr:TPA_asm: hypothetical protein HUJ06_024083 [Nelumbo nucifera]